MNEMINKWHGHIDITTICEGSCLYCSRFMRHTKKEDREHMPLDFFKKALDSYDEWPNRVGLMGGEPTLHPQFPEICEYMRGKKHPKFADDIRKRYSLFTSGGPMYEKYRDMIAGTFHYCEVFEHTDEQKQICKHQPLTLAIDDMVKDAQLKDRLINNCWIDHTWCVTITTRGAYFCEVAAAIDRVIGGPGGWPIEPGWWKRKLDDPEYLDQVNRLCGLCGAPVPVIRETLASKKERISRSLYERMKASGASRLSENDCIVVDEPFSTETILEVEKRWAPGDFRQDKYGDDSL